MSNQNQISLRLPSSWLESIDKRRGGMTRSIFLRRIVQRALRLPTVPDARGQYDRLAAGIMCPSSVDKELKRRVDIEKRRQAKREANRKPKGPPAPVEFIFTDGTITTAELSAMAQSVGYVCPDGTYTAETHRYSVTHIRAEVQKALAAGTLDGARWARFVERG